MPRWIHLRDHIRGLTQGDSKTIPQGKWIVLRLMRIGQYSSHWNYNTKEAVGGPKWLYDDVILRAISKPGSVQSALPGLNQSVEPIANTSGLEDVSQMVYAVEVTRDLPRYPCEGDRVYEISQFGSKTKPTPPLTARSMYEVLDVIFEHGDYGSPEVIYLLTQRMAGES